MKYFIHTFIIALFLIGGEALAQETPALVFVNINPNDVTSGASSGKIICDRIIRRVDGATI